MKNLFLKSTLIVTAITMLLFIYSCEQQAITDVPIPTTDDDVALMQDDTDDNDGDDSDMSGPSVKIIHNNLIYKGVSYKHEELANDEVSTRSLLKDAKYYISALTPEHNAMIEAAQESDEDIEIKVDLHVFDSEEQAEDFNPDYANLFSEEEEEVDERNCVDSSDHFTLKKIIFHRKENFKGHTYVLSNYTSVANSSVGGTFPYGFVAPRSVRASLTKIHVNFKEVRLWLFFGGSSSYYSRPVNGQCKSWVRDSYIHRYPVDEFRVQVRR